MTEPNHKRPLTLDHGRILGSRISSKHGFSRCEICKSKLMYYLSKGHGFAEIIKILSERHPDIRDIRTYARRAIRETTGHGIYDDYIIEHALWTVRNPCLADPEIHGLLEKSWKEYAERGRLLIEAEKLIGQSIEGDANEEITAKKETIRTIVSLFYMRSEAKE